MTEKVTESHVQLRRVFFQIGSPHHIVYKLPVGTLMIGRFLVKPDHVQHALSIGCKYASTEHCYVEVKNDGRIILRDVSSNGTYIKSGDNVTTVHKSELDLRIDDFIGIGAIVRDSEYYRPEYFIFKLELINKSVKIEIKEELENDVDADADTENSRLMIDEDVALDSNKNSFNEDNMNESIAPLTNAPDILGTGIDFENKPMVKIPEVIEPKMEFENATNEKQLNYDLIEVIELSDSSMDPDSEDDVPTEGISKQNSAENLTTESFQYLNQFSQNPEPIADNSPFENTQELKHLLEDTVPTENTIEFYIEALGQKLEEEKIQNDENVRKELLEKINNKITKKLKPSNKEKEHTSTSSKDKLKKESSKDRSSRKKANSKQKNSKNLSEHMDLFVTPDIPVAVPSTSKQSSRTDLSPKQSNEKNLKANDSDKSIKKANAKVDETKQESKMKRKTPFEDDADQHIQKIAKTTHHNHTETHNVKTSLTLQKETDKMKGCPKIQNSKENTKPKVSSDDKPKPKSKKTRNIIHKDPDIPIVDKELLPPSLEEVPIVEPEFEMRLFKRPTHRQAHRPVANIPGTSKPNKKNILSKLREETAISKIKKPVNKNDIEIFKIPKLKGQPKKRDNDEWIHSKSDTKKTRPINPVSPNTKVQNYKSSNNKIVQEQVEVTNSSIDVEIPPFSSSELDAISNVITEKFLDPKQCDNSVNSAELFTRRIVVNPPPKFYLEDSIKNEIRMPSSSNQRILHKHSSDESRANHTFDRAIASSSNIHDSIPNRAVVKPNFTTKYINVKDPRTPMTKFNWKTIVCQILSWDPLWMYSNTPNSNIYDSDELHSTKMIYSSYEQYIQTFVPLIKLEVWESISQECSKPGQSKTNKTRTAKIIHVSTRCPWHSDLYKVTARVMVQSKHELHLLRSKTLVIIYFANKCRRFGLIITEWVNSEETNLKDGILIDIVLTENDTVLQSQGEMVEIEFLRYIGNEIQNFETLEQIRESSLLPLILNPNRIDFQKTMVVTNDYYGIDSLNEIQGNIVQLISESAISENNNNIFIVEGPPGTGKSRLISNLIFQILHNPNTAVVPRILVCAPTNFAVDVICTKLINMKNKRPDRNLKFIRYGVADKIMPIVQKYTADELAERKMKRMISKEVSTYSSDAPMQIERTELIQQKSRFTNNKPEYHEISKELQAIELKMFKTNNKEFDFKKYHREMKMELIEGAEVVCTTLSSCVALQNASFKSFDFCIIDEATQALEIFALTPLRFNIKTLVMVGDTKQLPATVKSKLALKYNFGDSLFARIQSVVNTNQRRTMNLERQYRMDPEILSFPNARFYNGQIKTPDRIKDQNRLKLKPYLIFELSSTENLTQNPHSYNTDETSFVIDLLNAVTKLASPETHSICILTPYAKQKTLIEEKLTVYQKKYITVSTVDAIQGQEKDIVIFSTVRTNGVGFLASEERLNVALTRARKVLYICGNFQSLWKVDAWKNLIKDARTRRLCCPANLDREKLERCITKNYKNIT